MTPQSGRYEVGVQCRGRGEGKATFALRVNGTLQGTEWQASNDGNTWKSHAAKEVLLSQGEVIEIAVRGDGNGGGEIDFVQLTYLGPDDSAAMLGQIIVAPANPRWLKYNGRKRCFLFGAGNPEDFFFLGKRRADGARTGGKQSDIIRKLAATGANTFHVLAMRDSRYNIEPGNGAPDCNPFVDGDITGKLDEDILEQWESWLNEIETAELNVLFNFYNDFDDHEGQPR